MPDSPSSAEGAEQASIPLTRFLSERIMLASQGGVEVPTGGIPLDRGEPASASGGPEGQQIR
jgi:hypothetical protein